jgi:hypothetical protein
MSLCGGGAELWMPVLAAEDVRDGEIRLQGQVRSEGGQPFLEFMPLFALRQGGPNGGALAAYRMKLEDPQGFAERTQGSLTEAHVAGATRFEVVLRFPGPLPAALGETRAEMRLAVGSAAGPFESGATAVSLSPDRRLTRRLRRYAETPLKAVPFFIPFPFCLPLHRVSPATGGVMLWTQCIGFCPPFLSCLCYSFGMRRWSPFCGFWVPCWCWW